MEMLGCEVFTGFMVFARKLWRGSFQRFDPTVSGNSFAGNKIEGAASIG
jgi:hypothetical protein